MATVNELNIVFAEKAREINTLQASLASNDYKVIKCMEASLTGSPMPYDTEELHAVRQTMRDRINELQADLDALNARIKSINEQGVDPGAA